MDHITFWALLLTSINQGAGAAVTSAEENLFHRNQPRNTLCHQPTTFSSLTLAGSPAINPVPKPSSPPPPSITSGFEPPLPPPPTSTIITTTGKPVLRSEFKKKTGSSDSAGPDKKAPKT